MITDNSKKIRDRHANDDAQRCRRERVKKATAEHSQLRKDPAADVVTDQAKDDIRDASKPPAPGNFSRKPSCHQAEEQPRDEAVRLEPDSETLLQEQVCGEHETSKVTTDCS